MPVIVEGDSLAVQMRHALVHRVHIHAYDAGLGRTTRVGVDRLLARRDLRGAIVMVSLGTNDVIRNMSAREMARQARRVVRRARCVVWGEIRIGLYDRGRRVNAGLRRVHGLHLVPGVKPSREKVHLTPAGARERARRYARVARRYC